jgi:two-component system KDP operon response regulator KdpE
MSEKKTVLMIDDDMDFRFQKRLELEKDGFEVVEAETGAEGLEILENTKPDCVLVDLMMEQNDTGFTVCYQVKKKYPEVPVIMITGVSAETGIEFDAATDEERAWLKADALLVKPVRYEQLKREMERLIK